MTYPTQIRYGIGGCARTVRRVCMKSIGKFVCIGGQWRG